MDGFRYSDNELGDFKQQVRDRLSWRKSTNVQAKNYLMVHKHATWKKIAHETLSTEN